MYIPFMIIIAIIICLYICLLCCAFSHCLFNTFWVLSGKMRDAFRYISVTCRNYVLQSIVYQIMCKCHHGKSFFFSLWDSVGCLLMMGGALNTKNLIIHSFHFSLFIVVYIPNIQLFPSHWLELITRCGFFGGIIIASFLFWWTGVRLFRMSCWLTIKHATIRDQYTNNNRKISNKKMVSIC